MEYNALSQSDDNDEVASNASASDRSESSPQPNRRRAFQKLTLNMDNLGGPKYMNAARIGDQPSPSLGSVMRSLGPASTSSYDLLEDDDYDTPSANHGEPGYSFVRANHKNEINDSQPSSSSHNHQGYSSNNHNNIGASTSNHLRNATPATPAQPSEPLIRSPVSSRPVPLCHPTPDLQSLQGAYVGNVERLEKSAETLSTSSDIGEELRKLKQEQKRLSVASCSAVDHHPFGRGSPVRKFSTSSLSNSIIGVNTTARSNGYPPGDCVASPKSSVMSASRSQVGAAASRARSASVASRLAQVLEPENEDQTTQSHQPPADAAPYLQPLEIPEHDFMDNQRQDDNPHHHEQQQPPRDPDQPQPTYDETVPEERSTTASSTDTYRQSKALFKDFDGVHFTPFPRERVSGRRASLSKPPLARESPSFSNPPPGQKLVFYPAPVPMMLNLPPRRSKRAPEPQHEKRRTQLINSLPVDARKSAAWLPQLDPEYDGKDSTETRNNKRVSEIPPQLRASAYFEPPPAQIDIEIKQNSAVATLDSILDASAQAPVSAFTDHPIVGHVGAEVYGKPKAKRKLQPLAGKQGKHALRKSVGARDSVMPSRTGIRPAEQEGGNETEGHAAEGSDEVTPFHESYEGDQGPSGTNLHNDMERRDNDERNESRLKKDENSRGDDSEDGEEEEDEEDEEEETYVGAPTTLLAELQIRKQEQKQRNRTAATAFPNGMHSTLLELDAVAQHQRETRNQKHITLAWEDPGIAERNEPDNENVPLAVLFPKNLQSDENRPMGLMEKLELEENEPLSRRRARIRGGPIVGGAPMQRASPVFLPDDHINGNGHTNNNNEEENDDEEEGETLAQRARRLKAEEANIRLSRDFTSELLTKFGATSIDEPRSSTEQQAKDSQQQSPSTVPDSVEPPVEETLGQRRRRLQAEKAQAQAAAVGEDEVKNNFTATPIGKPRHNMATVLQAHPARNGGNNPYLNNGAAAGNTMRHSHQPLLSAQQQQQIPNRMSMMQQQGYGGNSAKYVMNLSSHAHAHAGHGSMGYGPGMGTGMSVGNGAQYPPTMGMNSSTGLVYGNGHGHGHGHGYGYGYGYPDAVAGGGAPAAGGQPHGPIIDPGQRDLIDRWRQSVRY
ncbi:hypothetical protein BDBG_07242 [Blastomyces gilchristii SLH14081]|uniref:Uncharacterized protein n=1 Tax=Blastomyces gilchristii (strain SLH14081) TaxID=559298 RepID=A0A179UX68_BLAGS|nr:uncharacterized protein BDBG_07242 [Blastomyces gilchristii SLH14081]OAT11819.1 hypothetical protein BDBG_07242 [Blastomyces gilchristii SLH14081]